MTQCLTMARGRRMRLTRVDECGTPVPGPAGSLVTSGFVSVANAPNYADPEEITQTNANGDPCIDDQGLATFRWIDLTIIFCQIDPDAFNIITGNPLVLNDATEPESVGFRINAEDTGTAHFALEIWSGATGASACEGGGAQYGYWLYPHVLQARVGEWNVENAALTMTLTARTGGGAGWDVGPYDVRNDAESGAAEPLLTPITGSDHLHFEITSLAPPEAACGAVELPEPVEGFVESLVTEES